MGRRPQRHWLAGATRSGLAILAAGTLLGGLSLAPAQTPTSTQRAAATEPPPVPVIRGDEIKLPTSPKRVPDDDDIRLAISKGLNFLATWQSPNGSWDRRENPDPMQVPDPMARSRFQSYRNPDDPRSVLWASTRPSKEPYDGPVKDLPELKETEHVADTCLSGLAMLRASARPEFQKKQAPHALKSVDFICKQIDQWDEKSIYIQKRTLDPLHDQAYSASDPVVVAILNRMRDPAPPTMEPRYFNPTVDTFFALWFLSEAQGRFSDRESEQRVQQAIGKLVRKIERNQTKDGTGRNGTWLDETDPTVTLTHAPEIQFKTDNEDPGQWVRVQMLVPNITTHCVATAAINIAARRGVQIRAVTLFAAEAYLNNAVKCLDPNDTLSWATCLAAVQEMITTNTALWVTAQKAAAAAPAGPERKRAEAAVEQLAKRASTLADLRHRTYRALAQASHAVPLRPNGAVLALLPSLLSALEEINPANAADLDQQFRANLLQRQEKDGGLRAWGGKRALLQRGDQTFATACTMLYLSSPPIRAR